MKVSKIDTYLRIGIINEFDQYFHIYYSYHKFIGDPAAHRMKQREYRFEVSHYIDEALRGFFFMKASEVDLIMAVRIAPHIGYILYNMDTQYIVYDIFEGIKYYISWAYIENSNPAGRAWNIAKMEEEYESL